MAKKISAMSNLMGFVLIVELIYLIILFVVAVLYLANLLKLPNSLGPIAIGVPWFGALGAVMISLSGIVDHRKDWDSSYKYWHFTRPLIGAAFAIVSVLIFQAGILAVGATPTTPQVATASSNVLYFLIAFLVGYREETFRELIKRLTDLIITPGGGAPPPVITSLSPLNGKVVGGDNVTIMGSGFTGTTSVKFGPVLAKFQVDSDTKITAVTPPGTAGKIGVTITTNAGNVTGGEFTYE